MAEREKFSRARAGASLPDLPPPKTTRGPGVHEAMLGETRLTFISDGAMTLPFRALAPSAPEGALEGLLGLDTTPEFARGELTHLLIDRGTTRILIDTGSGAGWQAGAGRLGAHLAANGIAPGSITHVVLTHLHPDHSWGSLTPDGALSFPRATHVVGQAEAAFWGNGDIAAQASPFARPVFEAADGLLRVTGDALRQVAEGDTILPGLHVLATPGHTPGHISLLLEDGPGLIITGDAVVNDLVSFAQPDWAFGFDMDDAQAAKSRRRVLGMAADAGHLMAGYHWRWPGLGHAERAGDGFAFVAA